MTATVTADRIATIDPLRGIFVHEAGDPGSPVVVFIHGGGPSGVMWRRHLDRLAPTLHCLAPDLPGFGRSHRLPDISLTDTADLVAELIARRAPTGRAHVVGLSYGGSVVLALLDRHPERVDRAIVDGSGILASRIDPLAIFGAALVSPVVGTRTVCALIERLGLHGLGTSLRGVSPPAMRRAFREGFTPRVSARLLEAPCPTLLVAGEKERTVRASDAALAALMPRAVACFVPGLGHAWFAWRHDLHVRMIAAWLAGDPLPADLEPEPPSPVAVTRVRRPLSVDQPDHRPCEADADPAGRGSAQRRSSSRSARSRNG